MSCRLFAGLYLGLAFILVIVGIGEFATDKPLSSYGKGGWLNGFLLLIFSERGARIALSTICFATATFVWHFAWKEWKNCKVESKKTQTSKLNSQEKT